MEPDLKEIETKLDKGEELTPEEKQSVMEIPPVEGDDEPEENPDEKLKAEEDPKPEETEEEPEEEALDEEKETKPEENHSEKDAEPAEAKKEEAEKAAKEVTDAARRKQIEEDAEKDLDQVDISKYSPNERAIFNEMKQERRKRQAAQREADTLRFQKLQDEKKKALEAEKQPVADPFEGMEEDDLLTVGQIKKVLAPKQTQPAAKPDVTPEVNKILAENWVLKGKAVYPDLPEVMAHAQDILGDDRDAEEEVKAVIKKGGNPAIAVYNLIKASPKWADVEKKLNPAKAPEKEEKKVVEDARINKDRAERIENNKKKTVTTGGSGGAASRPSEYSIQELLAMPDSEFAKLPSSQRKRILEQL